MSTELLPSNPQQLTRDEYVLIFRNELTKRFRGNQFYKGSEVNDVISYAVLLLWENYETVTSKHLCPFLYASQRFKHAAADYRRRMASERGEGAKNGRIVSSLDALLSLGDATPLQKGGGHKTIDQENDEMIINQMDDKYRVAQIMKDLPVFQQQVLRLCGMYGYTTVEAARLLGVTRETVSRAINIAKRTTKTFAAAS